PSPPPLPPPLFPSPTLSRSLFHRPRGLLVFEGLALHDVAPVARRVPDAEEDGLVPPARLLQRLGSPGVPEALERARREDKPILRSEEHTSELQSLTHLLCRP